MLWDVLQKNAALIWVFFMRGGGEEGSGPIEKSWGTFFCPKIFGIFGRNGKGGLTKSKSFWALFSQIVGEIRHQSAPKVSEKNLPTEKCLKSSKIPGWGV